MLFMSKLLFGELRHRDGIDVASIVIGLSFLRSE